MGIQLYDGAILLDFDKKSHRYTVYEDDGHSGRKMCFAVPSVTQVLDLMNKPALVQWAANATTEYLRTRILAGQSYDEIALDEMLNDARFNFRKISSRAKSVGGLVHEWIEATLAILLGGEGIAPPFPINQQAANSCKAAMDWMSQHKFEPLQPEVKLYSRKHKVAGTMDWPAKVNGRLSIVDWKTSKGIYDEMILQVDAYACMYEEMTGERVQDCWIVRIDKETAEVEPVCVDAERKKKGLNPRAERKANFKAFLGLKAMHERMLVLKNGGKATTNLLPALEKSLKVAAQSAA